MHQGKKEENGKTKSHKLEFPSLKLSRLPKLDYERVVVYGAVQNCSNQDKNQRQAQIPLKLSL